MNDRLRWNVTKTPLNLGGAQNLAGELQSLMQALHAILAEPITQKGGSGRISVARSENNALYAEFPEALHVWHDNNTCGLLSTARIRMNHENNAQPGTSEI